MSKYIKYLIAIVLILAAGSCLCADEVYRIRVQNTKNGLVQVSMDQGRSYATVGRVNVAANARITGFAASSYTPSGAIAAVAVHGIRIKTGQSAMGVGIAQLPMMFSIIPRQFAKIPNRYGGHIARSSGILTDIDAGHSIFRNLSPYVGSKVFVERKHSMQPLPEDYIPIEGETFVIPVTKPRDMPSEVVFENRAGGNVTAKYPDGSSKVIAGVDRPVMGVGRYDGTTFTGVGWINTNHGGVITISTAPTCLPSIREGAEKVETRGGFMIQPYYHVMLQGEASPQVMVIGPMDKTKPIMEGTPPLFSGYINLSRFPDKPKNSYLAQIRIDDGDWEDMPKILGKVNDAFTSAYLQTLFPNRQITTGVTAIRLLFPEYDAKLAQHYLTTEATDYTEKALKSGIKPQKGIIRLSPNKPYNGKCMVTFYIDGDAIDISNQRPYSYQWDTRTVPNGLHCIKIESVPASGDSIVESWQVLVRN